MCCNGKCREGRHRPAGAQGGFSLIELLTATAILIVLSLLLAGISGNVGRIWAQGESLNQHRTRARAALEFMGREMKTALLSPDSSSAASLQFLINPSEVSQTAGDSAFWQAPMAGNGLRSDIAALGYFVRWTASGQAHLYRLYIPSDAANFLIHTAPDAWVSDAILDAEAPGDEAGGYRGLFLENVVGLWITALASDGTPHAGGYDSRAETNRLPAAMDISMAFLDEKTAKRVKDSPALVASLKAAASSSENAGEFLEKPGISAVRPGLGSTSFRVSPLNR